MLETFRAFNIRCERLNHSLFYQSTIDILPYKLQSKKRLYNKVWRLCVLKLWCYYLYMLYFSVYEVDVLQLRIFFFYIVVDNRKLKFKDFF